MLWILWIQFLVSLANAIYFFVLYKKAKLVPLPLVLFCIADALTAPANLWASHSDSDESVTAANIASWVFSIAEVVFIPAFLSNLISKKYNPSVPLFLVVILPFLLKYLFNVYDFDLSLNYFLSGILISYHCYRVIIYTLSPNTRDNRILVKNQMVVFGIMICYVTSVPFSIGSIAHMLFSNMFKIHIDSHWVNSAFLLGNIIQHIFFFISYRWHIQRQPL